MVYFLNDGFVTEIVSTVMSRGLPVSSSNKTNKLSPGWRNDLGTLYLEMNNFSCWRFSH